MHINIVEQPPLRKCDKCKAPMVLVSTLPARGNFPMLRVYKCSAAVAQIVSVHNRHKLDRGVQIQEERFDNLHNL